MGDFEGVTEVLYQRGVLLNKLRDIGGARAQLTQALDKARANGFLPQQILALLQLSGVSFGAGELAQAQRQASEAVALARSNGLENLTTRGLIDLGNTFFSSGKHAEAEKYYAQALEFARRYKGRRNEARAVFMLGSSLINRGQIDEGLPYAEQAYNFYRQGGYRKEAAQAALLFGRAKRDLGDYEAALQIFRRRLQQAEESNDRSLIAFSHKEIGVVLAQSERYPEALQHFELCSSINNILGDKETAAYSSALQADMLWRIGRFAEARDILNRLASDMNKQDKSFNSVAAHAHLIKGKLELSYLRFPSAMDAGRKAFAMVERRSDHTAIDALLILGLAQAYSGTARAGVKSCRDAVVASEQVKDQWRLSASMLALGETLLLNGDAEGALQNAMRAREGFERRGQRDSLWRAWLLAARAGHLLKDEATARDYSMRAADLFSSLPQFWGKDAYEGYLTRPDIRQERQRLDALLAVGRSPERNH
jgi:tetratricopeptide (TPR) repeat protein